MNITAEAKYIKVSPRKVRLVAAVVRKMAAGIALEQLLLMPKTAAGPIADVLKSAIANATNNHKLAVDGLIIEEIIVGGGPALKRFRPVSRGRAHSFKKRMSHIKVVLAEKESMKKALVKSEQKEEAHGTKS